MATSALFFMVVSTVVAASPRLILNDDESSGCLLGDEARIAASGDLHVAVSNLAECLPSGTGLGVSQVLVVPNSVLPPGEVQVIWTSVGADSCRAGGSLPAWNNIGTLPLEGQQTFNVPSGTSSGAYRLEVLCSLGGGEEVSGQVNNNLTVTSPSAPPQPSLSLSTSGPISPGASVTVTWSSQSATSCSAGGTFPGWDGTKATSGSQSITTSSSLTPNTYSLTLSCSNSGGTSPTAQTSIEVAEGTPTACSGDRAPPPGLVRATACLLSPQAGDCREYSSIFDGFPGETSLRLFSLQGNRYAAMRIPATTIPSAARADIAYDMLQNPYGGYAAGPFIWSISTCPGDFNQQQITAEQGPGCVGAVPFGLPIGFGGSSFQSNLGRCALQSGTTYYLNILYTSQEPGTPNSQLNWNCPSNNCGHQLQLINRFGW